MAAMPRDALLTITYFVARAATILLIGFFIAVIIGGGLVAFDIASGSDALRSEYPGVDIEAFKNNLTLLLPTALVGIGLAAVFFRLLAKIIATVGEGDPFVPINARRLHTMAWLALAFQTIAIPVRLLEARMDVISGQISRFEVDISGFVLVLTLFVLARVFAHGAAMRDDLEGTV